MLSRSMAVFGCSLVLSLITPLANASLLPTVPDTYTKSIAGHISSPNDSAETTTTISDNSLPSHFTASVSKYGNSAAGTVDVTANQISFVATAAHGGTYADGGPYDFADSIAQIGFAVTDTTNFVISGNFLSTNANGARSVFGVSIIDTTTNQTILTTPTVFSYDSNYQYTIPAGFSGQLVAGDHYVFYADVNTLAQSPGASATVNSFATLTLQSLPEPASFAIVACAGLFALRRRRPKAVRSLASLI